MTMKRTEFVFFKHSLGKTSSKSTSDYSNNKSGTIQKKTIVLPRLSLLGPTV